MVWIKTQPAQKLLVPSEICR